MHTRRWVSGFLLYSAGILTVTVAAAYGFLYYGYTQNTHPAYNAVVALPNHYSGQHFAPYKGPHPRNMSRPTDPYNYPINPGETGPLDPLWSGPLQYPFACMSERSDLGQPLVDNNEGVGVPVFEMDQQGVRSETVLGYSKNCLIASRVLYYGKNIKSGRFQAIDDIAPRYRLQRDGRDSRFRIEVGVINRYLYLMIMPAGDDDSPLQADTRRWNRQLIYQFKGGVGIGKRQGRLSIAGIMKRRAQQLDEGYAVIYSTANQTSNHYNMWIAEEVAYRLKRNFIARFGEPDYTIGVGGSGGAIQQYLIAQNHPGLLDGLIPLYSYPDMVTQITYAYDCELLEYYFDQASRQNPLWQDWATRQKVQGLNTRAQAPERYPYSMMLARLIHGVRPIQAQGSSECINGWRGLTPVTNNPRFVHFAEYYSDDVRRQSHWTHWDDLKQFYGTDAAGFANQAWDNVGVQYGLRALREGNIQARDFIHLNASIGSWEPASEQAQERYGHLSFNRYFWKFSPWSHHNIRQGTLEHPAPRAEASTDAIRATFQSGHVFLGEIDIPIVDLRHYLEDELDMHHFGASFVTRTRLLDGQGNYDNHLVWVTHKPHTPVNDAFSLILEWLQNGKPETAVDSCFDRNGNILAAGSSVWNGSWNNQPPGACMQHYPTYSDPRQAAGGNVRGTVFKCQLKSFEQAIEDGDYGSIDMRSYKRVMEKIFPAGVCDFAKPDFALHSHSTSTCLSLACARRVILTHLAVE